MDAVSTEANPITDAVSPEANTVVAACTPGTDPETVSTVLNRAALYVMVLKVKEPTVALTSRSRPLSELDALMTPEALDKAKHKCALALKAEDRRVALIGRQLFIPFGISKACVDAITDAGFIVEYKCTLSHNPMPGYIEPCELNCAPHDISNAENNFEERKKLMTKGGRSKQRRKW